LVDRVLMQELTDFQYFIRLVRLRALLLNKYMHMLSPIIWDIQALYRSLERKLLDPGVCDK
jgi:hypothetical protein